MRGRSFGWVLILTGCFLSVALATDESVPTTQPTTQPGVTQGVIIEQSMTMPGAPQQMPPSRMTLYFKGSQYRSDVESYGMKMSMIWSSDGSSISLMHSSRTYTKKSASKTKEGLENTAAMAESAVPTTQESKVWEDTGKEQVIRGFKARAYTYEARLHEGAPTKMTSWFVQDYPDADEMAKIMSNAQFASIAGELVPANPPGSFAIRTEMETPYGIAVTDVISAKLSDVHDSLFEIPADYKQTDVPMP